MCSGNSVCMYIMYVCHYGFMPVCISAFVVCMSLQIHVLLYVCMCLDLCICMYVVIDVCMCEKDVVIDSCVYVFICLCIFVCINGVLYVLLG